MKKAGIQPIILIFVVFLTFLLGFFFGRTNQPKSLSASEYIQLPSEAIVSDTKADATAFIDGKLNINAAQIDDLMLLPGIGNVLAQRIIDYRTENGPFSSVDDLMKVKGIGKSILSNISPYITLGG